MTQWEPREALLAGPDGLDAYRAMAATLRERSTSRIAGKSALSAELVVGLEVGEGQAGAVGALLAEAGFGEVETRRDLAGIERVVVGRNAAEA